MPETARFISEDNYRGIAFEPRTQNYYAYCDNNPLIYIDPSGFSSIQSPNDGPFSIPNLNDPNDAKSPYYGGAQRWFSEDWMKNSACGSTAAANTLAYMAYSDPDKYGALYGYSDFSKENYTNFMEEVIGEVTPIHATITIDGIPISVNGSPTSITFEPSIGIPTVSRYVNGVTEYASNRGISLEAQTGSNYSMGYLDTVSFVKEGLDADAPVSMLMYHNPNESLEYFNWHWVTITGLEYDANTNSYIATVSSWGERYELDFEDIWYGSTYVGFAYFQDAEVCE
jgi:hypothetical protein